MTLQINTELLNQTIDIAKRAGLACLEVYERKSGYQTETKADSSPVTEADIASHHVILDALNLLTPTIPIISEEETLPAFETRSQWKTYWIIDPLDGTKEFINGNGEFTVNIALIENGVPILGVVDVPVLGITYSGAKGIGAFKLDKGNRQAITCNAVKQEQTLHVMASRRHGSSALEKCLNKLENHFNQVKSQSMGSSLKLCLVAEGKADIYPRLAPTSEWDTAAAQAVVEAAGGRVLDDEFNVLRYNQKSNILNPFFYVLGDPNYAWENILK